MDSITLLELNKRIAEVVNTTFDDFVWVVAEISEIHSAANGHCYLELIEKSKRGGSIAAKARATIWANRWWLIKEAFESVTGNQLKAGIKVLFQVQVQMHEAFGLSLNIVDIDPNYTLGEIAQRRLEIIRRLEQEGIMEMNKELPMPIIPQRIAIISAENAAGYGDFCHQLDNNEFGIKFYSHLFPAVMQGSNTEKSIISALDKVFKYSDLFDVVVIIRGGGGTADLNSFDSYDIAVNIANFPIPVIVGIGHERDNTVIDLVAHTSVKTPTAAAEFLIGKVSEEYSAMELLKESLVNIATRRIETEKLRQERAKSVIVKNHARLIEQQNHLSLASERIKLFTKQRLERDRQKHLLISNTINLCKPDNMLKKGFSIVRGNGKVIKDANKVSIGTILEIETSNGKINTIVTNK